MGEVGSMNKLMVLGVVAVVTSTMVFAAGAMASDDSPIATQGNASPSSTGNAINKEAPSHHYSGLFFESGEYNLSSVSDPNARCRKSKLTQEQFLEMVQAVVKHGDLTDKDSIEKTLKIKFGPTDNRLSSGMTLYSTYMPGDTPNAPILVELYAGIQSKDVNGQPQTGEELTLEQLNMVGAVFHNCQYLTKKQFKQKFDGAFRDGFRDDSGILNFGKVGKGDSNIEMYYSFDAQDDALKQVTISQHVDTHREQTGANNGEHREQ